MTSDSDAPPNAPPLAYRAVRGGLWVALSSYWTIGFGFLVTIGLTRVLPAEAFGRFAYAMFFAQLLSLSPKLGLKYAFVQHKETTDKALGTYTVMEFAAAAASLFLTLIAFPVLPGSVVAICLVMALTAFAGLGGIGSLLLEKEMHLGRTSLVESVIVPLSYIPAFVVAVRGGGAWSLVAQVVSHRIMTLLVYVWVARAWWLRVWRSLWHFDLALARQFLRLGVSVGVSSYVSSLTVTLDSFFIGRFVGEVTLGYYDRARRTASWPSTLLTNMVSRTSLYTYAKIQDDPERLRKATTMVSWTVSLLAFPIALAIFVSAPDMILLLYGEQWLPSVPYLSILVFVSAALPLVENMGTLFAATGRADAILWSAIVQVAVMALVGLPMTLAWGALGTAAATGIAIVVRTLLMLAMVRRLHIELHKVLVVPILACVLTLVVYMALSGVLRLDALLLPVRFVIKAGSAAGLYLLIAVALRPRVVSERLAYIWRLLRG